MASNGDGTFDRWRLFGTTLPQYGAWQLGTLVGAYGGDVIGDLERFGLDAVYPAFFLAILVPELRDRDRLGVAVAGGLVALALVRDVADACDRVDASPFGLTGGLFARNPDTVDYVVDRSPVGNLYVNRAITGAMVGRQPFGGNRLSGTGTKAGGPGYLLHFVEPRVVTENTMRHGLVV